MHSGNLLIKLKTKLRASPVVKVHTNVEQDVKEGRYMDEELFNIRVALIKHIEFVQQKMSEIEAHSNLTIHQMADLERYASTLKFLSDAYSDFI